MPTPALATASGRLTKWRVRTGIKTRVLRQGDWPGKMATVIDSLAMSAKEVTSVTFYFPSFVENDQVRVYSRAQFAAKVAKDERYLVR
jgi:hypothetical protein